MRTKITKGGAFGRLISRAMTKVIVTAILAFGLAACGGGHLQAPFPVTLTPDPAVETLTFQYKRDLVEFYKPSATLETRLTALRTEAEYVPSLICAGRYDVVFRQDEIVERATLGTQYYLSNVVFQCLTGPSAKSVKERAYQSFEPAKTFISDRAGFTMQHSNRDPVIFLYVGSRGGVFRDFEEFAPGILFREGSME